MKDLKGGILPCYFSNLSDSTELIRNVLYHFEEFFTSKSFEVCLSVSLFICLFVYKHILCHNVGARILILFPLMSLVRIEHDQILSKSVAFSHSYDHFNYLATKFTIIRQDFEVCNSAK